MTTTNPIADRCSEGRRREQCVPRHTPDCAYTDSARDILSVLLAAEPYIPEIHGDDEPEPLSPEREVELRKSQLGDWFPPPWTYRFVEPGAAAFGPAVPVADAAVAAGVPHWQIVHEESGTVLAVLPGDAGPLVQWMLHSRETGDDLLAELDRVRVERDELKQRVPTQGDLAIEPLPLRWDRLVIHPAIPSEDDTIICCTTMDDGRPAALFLDDEHREALGLQLVEPDGDSDGTDTMTPQTCPKGIHADWAVDSEHTHTCPWCELDELKKRVAELEAERHSTNDSLAVVTEAFRAAETERDGLKQRLHEAAMTKTWTNEDGKKFVFVEDIAPALLGRPAKGGIR